MSGEHLTEDRLRAAIDTLSDAFGAYRDGTIVGAIGAEDPGLTFVEAKRNLTAALGELHGQDAWERELDRQAWRRSQ